MTKTDISSEVPANFSHLVDNMEGQVVESMSSETKSSVTSSSVTTSSSKVVSSSVMSSEEMEAIPEIGKELCSGSESTEVVMQSSSKKSSTVETSKISSVKQMETVVVEEGGDMSAVPSTIMLSGPADMSELVMSEESSSVSVSKSSKTVSSSVIEESSSKVESLNEVVGSELSDVSSSVVESVRNVESSSSTVQTSQVRLTLLKKATKGTRVNMLKMFTLSAFSLDVSYLYILCVVAFPDYF